MIPPAFLVAWVGKRQRIPLPVPLFLLWPFLLLGYLFIGLGWMITPPTKRAARFGKGLMMLEAFRHLSGMQVNIDTARSESFSLKFY
ncbi:MAG: hypothetical protein GY835_11125 [bacterium]|nr:hypothetical protein [bacterium]